LRTAPTLGVEPDTYLQAIDPGINRHNATAGGY